jgi:hypothetical protein
LADFAGVAEQVHGDQGLDLVQSAGDAGDPLHRGNADTGSSAARSPCMIRELARSTRAAFSGVVGRHVGGNAV